MATVNLQSVSETNQTRGPRRLEQSTERANFGRSASASSSSTNSDAVRVSGRAEKARALVANLRALPDIRQERVDDVQLKLGAGAYHPASDRVAEAILKAA